MPKDRLTLATGIYSDPHGIGVVYHSHGKPIETRFERGHPLDLLIRWRKQQMGAAETLAPRDPRGSMTRDAVRYLKRLKGLPGYRSEKAHLRAWLIRFGAQPRWKLTEQDCAVTIAAWRKRPYAARTIRHRIRVLKALYHALDGPRAATPVDNLKPPQKPKARPVTVADDAISSVALQLRANEERGTLRDGKTRARFLVLATTGKRPVEMTRARREDVDLARRLWMTRTAKGGYNTEVLLNDQQLAAWHLFIAAQAWGAYDTSSFSKTIQRAGWPKGIRPYQMRHSVARTIRRRGGDPSDVQEALGHASIETGRSFYYGASPEQQAKVSGLLDNRFGASVFEPLPRRPTTRRQQNRAKGTKSKGMANAADRGRARPSKDESR